MMKIVYSALNALSLLMISILLLSSCNTPEKVDDSFKAHEVSETPVRLEDQKVVLELRTEPIDTVKLDL